MTDLNINAGEIAAALRKNLEGFSPTIGTATVGRIAEVGDGIARVTGLPGAPTRWPSTPVRAPGGRDTPGPCRPRSGSPWP